MKPSKPWGPVLAAIGSLLYGVSPIDIVPDFIPVLGQLDDVAVIGLAGIVVYRYLKQRRKPSLR